MMVISWLFHRVVVAAEVMVMPRSCSSTIQSILVVALVDLSHPVLFAGVEENPFGDRGLAGVDVRDDADIAAPRQRRPCFNDVRHKSDSPKRA